MQISTSLLPRSGRISSLADVAVVIDVLRATSVMASALEAGAAQIITCREVAEARAIADQGSPRPLLCGERGCKPIDGFDLGNSPAEYVSARVQGKTLVLTTTNGTRAIDAAADAARMITASFLNFSAVIDQLRGTPCVHLVCAGTEGEITAEDALLAGAILCECETRYRAVWHDDESILAGQLWRSWFPGADPTPHALSRRLRETRGGQNLLKAGYEGDLDRCAQMDSMSAVPERIGRSPTTFA
jgi:2-phosphosulfolactate phosphatase